MPAPPSRQLLLSLYLLPVFGVIPALWTLTRRGGDREQRDLSRLALALALVWAVSYGALWTGAGTGADVLSFRLLYLNGLLSTGYIASCLAISFRVWQGRRPRLPRSLP